MNEHTQHRLLLKEWMLAYQANCPENRTKLHPLSGGILSQAPCRKNIRRLGSWPQWLEICLETMFVAAGSDKPVSGVEGRTEVASHLAFKASWVLAWEHGAIHVARNPGPQTPGCRKKPQHDCQTAMKAGSRKKSSKRKLCSKRKHNQIGDTVIQVTTYWVVRFFHLTFQ